jgi:membrane protease YdiL (CAAX protease family)
MTIVATAVMEAGFLVGILSIHAFYVAHSDEPRTPFQPRLALRSGVATFLVAMPLVMGTSYAWELLLERMGLPETKQELVGILEGTHSARLRWVFIAVATLLVPVTEEAVFRGGIFRYMRDRAPRWFSIAASSAIFGAMHVSWSDHMNGLPSLLPLIVLASIFCVAYERTGQIGTSIVAHALFNLNMIVLVFAGVGS